MLQRPAPSDRKHRAPSTGPPLEKQRGPGPRGPELTQARPWGGPAAQPELHQSRAQPLQPNAGQSRRRESLQAGGAVAQARRLDLGIVGVEPHEAACRGGQAGAHRPVGSPVGWPAQQAGPPARASSRLAHFSALLRSLPAQRLPSLGAPGPVGPSGPFSALSTASHPPNLPACQHAQSAQPRPPQEFW